MRRRVHLEFLGHTTIKLTNFAFHKTFDLNKFSDRKMRLGFGIDLVTLKLWDRTIKPIPKFELLVAGGTGKLGDPYELVAYAETEKGLRTKIGDVITIYKSKEITIEVDFPEENEKGKRLK